MRGYMGAMQPDGGMPELLKRQIDRLETAIDLSTDWLEIQYLMVELDQLKALYEEADSEAASAGFDISLTAKLQRVQQHVRPACSVLLIQPCQRG